MSGLAGPYVRFICRLKPVYEARAEKTCLEAHDYLCARVCLRGAAQKRNAHRLWRAKCVRVRTKMRRFGGADITRPRAAH